MKKIIVIVSYFIISCTADNTQQLVFLEPNPELSRQKIDDGQMIQSSEYPSIWYYEDENVFISLEVGGIFQNQILSEAWHFENLLSSDSAYIMDFIDNYNFANSKSIIQIRTSIDSDFDYDFGSQHFLISNFSLNSILFDGRIDQTSDSTFALLITYYYFPN